MSDCIVTENTAAEIIGLLDLRPHAEHGLYRAIPRDTLTGET